MNLLTDEEIWQAATHCTIGGDLHADKFARAIEAAVLEKLTKVDVEPLTTAKFTTTMRMGKAASMGEPLYPASALAAEQAKVLVLVEVLDDIQYDINTSEFSGRDARRKVVDAIAKYGEQK